MKLALMHIVTKCPNAGNHVRGTCYIDYEMDKTTTNYDILSKISFEDKCSFKIFDGNNLLVSDNCLVPYNDIILNLPTFGIRLNISVETIPETKYYLEICVLDSDEHEKLFSSLNSIRYFYDKLKERSYEQKCSEILEPVLESQTDIEYTYRLAVYNKTKYFHLDSDEEFSYIDLILNGHTIRFSGDLLKFLAKRKKLNGYVFDFENNVPGYLNCKRIDNIQLKFPEVLSRSIKMSYPMYNFSLNEMDLYKKQYLPITILNILEK